MKYKQLQKFKTDTRFRKTIGKLVYAGLIDHKTIPAWNGQLSIDEALWAGEVEPRILELIPALILKKPKFFYHIDPLPDDLQFVLRCIRKNQPAGSFRGVEASKYLYWVDKVGRKQKMPSILKTFRFSLDDQKQLQKIKESLNISEIEIIRRGLKALL